jgi:hypothetical protein
MLSEAPPPSAGRCQFCSTNFTTEECSVSVLSTWFCAAYGEITSSGRRGPTPQRAWMPSMAGLVWHRLSESSEVLEPLTIGPATWSYQPSESS